MDDGEPRGDVHLDAEPKRRSAIERLPALGVGDNSGIEPRPPQ